MSDRLTGINLAEILFYINYLKVLFPLPPLPEQHRIVAKVDRLMALCDQLEAQLTKQTEKQTALSDEVIAAI